MWDAPPMRYGKKDNMIKGKEVEFKRELKSLINRYNRESISNTPDFILAEYLMVCLDNFETMVNVRTVWYGESSKFPSYPIKLESNKI